MTRPDIKVRIPKNDIYFVVLVSITELTGRKMNANKAKLRVKQENVLCRLITSREIGRGSQFKYGASERERGEGVQRKAGRIHGPINKNRIKPRWWRRWCRRRRPRPRWRRRPRRRWTSRRSSPGRRATVTASRWQSRRSGNSHLFKYKPILKKKTIRRSGNCLNRLS